MAGRGGESVLRSQLFAFYRPYNRNEISIHFDGRTRGTEINRSSDITGPAVNIPRNYKRFTLNIVYKVFGAFPRFANFIRCFPASDITRPTRDFD